MKGGGMRVVNLITPRPHNRSPYPAPTRNSTLSVPRPSPTPRLRLAQQNGWPLVETVLELDTEREQGGCLGETLDPEDPQCWCDGVSSIRSTNAYTRYHTTQCARSVVSGQWSVVKRATRVPPLSQPPEATTNTPPRTPPPHHSMPPARPARPAPSSSATPLSGTWWSRRCARALIGFARRGASSSARGGSSLGLRRQAGAWSTPSPRCVTVRASLGRWCRALIRRRQPW